MSTSNTSSRLPAPRVLVTGATGLVGRHVVQQLLRQGYAVRALVRAGSGADLPGAVERTTGDLSDPTTFPSAVQGIGGLVHCAARVGDWGPDQEFFDINVCGTEALALAVARHAPGARFVQISSLGVYPSIDHHGTTEAMPLTMRGLDGYARSKLQAEERLRVVAREHQLPFVVLRPGFIYGVGDRTVLPRLLQRLAARQVRYLGSDETLLNNTAAASLAEAVVLALESPAAVDETFNITDLRCVTKREFIESIARLAELPVPTRTISFRTARVLASVLEFVWKLRRAGTAPPLSKANLKFMGRNLDFSIEKARRVLGYAPQRDFQQAIRETMAWATHAGLVPARPGAMAGGAGQPAVTAGPFDNDATNRRAAV